MLRAAAAALRELHLNLDLGKKEEEERTDRVDYWIITQFVHILLCKLKWAASKCVSLPGINTFPVKKLLIWGGSRHISSICYYSRGELNWQSWSSAARSEREMIINQKKKKKKKSSSHWKCLGFHSLSLVRSVFEIFLKIKRRRDGWVHPFH